MAKPGQMLLKTCQTCFKAKIRCHTTQSSRACDRCARLKKTCVFAPSRRYRASSPLSAPRASQAESAIPAAATPTDPHDPFALGLLNPEKGEILLDRFRSTMAPRFPFVVLPDGDNRELLKLLRRERPHLCLAVLAASASDDFVLQRELSRLFNKAVASGLTTGRIRTLDVLQGLLVHLAWAHYQPRPRSYSQHLHLATSIVADMRLDRPRNPTLWKVHLADEGQAPSEWGPDERRALAGAYYLASSSSVVLQKMRHFPFAPFLLESCERLALQGTAPTDGHVRHIVRMQHLAEEFDDLVAAPALDGSARLAVIQRQIDALKAELVFPLGECPTLLLQLGMLELVISQQSLPGSPLSAGAVGSEAQVTGVFSDSVLAARSLLNILITMTPGQEKSLTNLEWVSLSYTFSFAARLDLLMADARVAHLTGHIRRLLDFRHTLRQIILRLKSLIAPGEDRTGDRDTFSHFLRRAEIVNVWYSRQTQPPQQDSASSDVSATPADGEITVAEQARTYASGLGESTDLFALDFFTEMQGAGPWLPQLSDDFGLAWPGEIEGGPWRSSGIRQVRRTRAS